MSEKARIKLLYIISSFMQCGPINMLYSLVSSMDQEVFDINVVTLKKEPANSRIRDFQDLSVSVYSTSDKASHFLFGLRKPLQHVIDELQPDIVHSHGPWADHYLGKLKVRNSVMSIHNKLAGDYIPLYGPLIGFLTTKQDASAMRKADLNIAVSNSVARTAKTEYGIESCVIYNGVDIEEYAPCGLEQIKALRKNLNIREDAYVFLHIGNMIIRKQPKLIADAFKKALNSNPNMELIFLGDGPLLEELQRENAACKKIHFCGNVNNVSDYMKASDAMVSATTSDGLSMATLEGLACGLKGLMSDIDVHQEILENLVDDPNDFIICENDVESYAKGFLVLAKTKGQCNSVEKKAISKATMADQYAKTYRTMLDNEKRRG